MANLRGSVLPILDLRRVLGLGDVEYNDATRVVVTDAGSPLGLVVDRVSRVLDVARSRIDPIDSSSSAIDADLLTGVIKGEEGEPLTQLLNLKRMIGLEFSAVLASTSRRPGSGQKDFVSKEDLDESQGTDELVSFMVNDQEYAFDLMEVEEIVRLPDEISRVPRSDAHVMGLIELRGQLLPLVSLRKLFALPGEPLREDSRILVVGIRRPDGHKDSVGLVVDDVKEVLRVPRDVRDPMPSLLSMGEKSVDIADICRLEGGRRLVSVLRAESLFNHAAIQAAMQSQQAPGEETMSATPHATEATSNDLEDTDQLVVFKLMDQEFGVSIEDVQEITRIPEQVDKVPGTPDFIIGMINLRGTVLPVLDMRLRFQMAAMEQNDRQRIVVLSLEGKRTGFVVDAVTEVLRLANEQIETSPTLSDKQARIMGRVVNLKERKRMIQVLEAVELITSEETLELSEFEASSEPSSALAA